MSGWLAFALALPALVLAQTPPDAGALRQQIERERLPALPARAAPEKPATPPALTPAEGFSVTVKAFRFAGNVLLSNETLAAAVAGYLGRALDFAQLQAAGAAVAQRYRDAGWIVRAYLPQQDITEGIVTIQVVEAVFGGLRIDGTARVSADRLRGVFADQQGRPLKAEALDRALLLADDLPGVAATGALEEGGRHGETDLVLKLSEEPLLAGSVALDNNGSRSTGAERVAASLSLGSPLGLGDQFSAQAIHTRGSDYAQLAYTLPAGYDGWRAGANVSRHRYRLIAGEFATLDARGDSATTGLETSYPLVRSRLKNLYLSAALERKGFNNESLGAVTTRYASSALVLGLAGNLFDNWGGGGANSASFMLTRGRLDLDGSPNQAADASTTQAHGGFAKLRYSFSRQQILADQVSLYTAISGQKAGGNLDSSEKFYLGGAQGVRAYPGSEGGGAEGHLLSIELRWRLPDGFNLVAFHDSGRVRVNKHNDFTGAPALNAFDLRGHGLALGWHGMGGLQLKAVWAHREGGNPNPTAAGLDQDGSLVRNRWWLMVSIAF